MSYSLFFASGLMAACRSPPSSPVMSIPDSPIIPSTPTRILSDLEDTTPTRLPYVVQHAERPKLRKRRSSLTTTSPFAQIKSPLRNASSAAQRQNTFAHVSTGNNRSRSGSVHDNFAYGYSRSSGFATDNNSLLGRLRSGSVNGAVPSRPRRVLRRPAPPPSVPLPPIPLSSVPAADVFEADSSPNTPRRRPLVIRPPTADNYEQAMPDSPMSSLFVLDGLEDPFPKVSAIEVDDVMKEN